jgi:serine/threonine protein kinase
VLKCEVALRNSFRAGGEVPTNATSGNVSISSEPLALGDYDLVAEIGTDELATIHLARVRNASGSKIALVRKLHPSVARHDEVTKTLLAEASDAARLIHDNIVRVLAAGSASGVYFAATEQLHGQPLDLLIGVGNKHQQALNIYDAARLVADVANALDAAHCSDDTDAVEFLHGDVRPGNIIVLYNGHTKLDGFGLAGARHKLSGIAGPVPAHVGYTAPERTRGGAADARSDVFALGVVLWEALALRRLYQASDETAALGLMSMGKPARPSATRKEIPRELDDICLRALATDPNERYQSARELRIDIENFLWTANYSREAGTLTKHVTSLFADRIAALDELVAQALCSLPEDSQAAEGLF